MEVKIIKLLCSECQARFEEVYISEKQIFQCLSCQSDKVLFFPDKKFCEKNCRLTFEDGQLCGDCEGCGC